MNDQSRLPILRLVREDVHEERRLPQGRTPPAPDRGGRGSFGPRLHSAISRIEQFARERELPAGIEPHLIFKIPLAAGANVDEVADRLQDAGVRVVSVDPGDVIVAFSDDDNLSGFENIVDRYERGPRTKPDGTAYASTSADFVEFIEADEMRSLVAEDRLGPRLRASVGTNVERLELERHYVLDLELWHRGSRALIESSRGEVEQVLSIDPDGAILDHYFGRSIALLRISCRGLAVHQLLELDVVAEIDLPPQQRYALSEIRNLVIGDFPEPPVPLEDGPRLCVIDSGVATNHPLLASNIGYAETLLVGSTSAADGYGHGTGVGSVAVFGDIQACIDAGSFASPITLYSARVLNDSGQFEPEKLLVNVVSEAISYFVRPPYNCRVFNISLYDPDYIVEAPERQSTWAENLDTLARDLKVTIVLAAGNRFRHTGTHDEAEHVLTAYPSYLLEEDNRLVDPASASLCITVGSIAEEGLGDRGGIGHADIRRPIAQRGEVSPFSRRGPGYRGALKPEFVEVGGNHVFQGTAGARSIGDDGVVLFCHEPYTRGLFTFAAGTSYAAPQLTRTAALVEHQLRNDLKAEPHANLVRAMLAQAAEWPEELSLQAQDGRIGDRLKDLAGFGRSLPTRSLYSAGNRVVMVSQGSIGIDRFQIFEIPTPLEFWRSGGEKTIRIALAYDPPVNRRQRRYFGVEVLFNLYRNVDLEALIELLRKRQPEEGTDEPEIEEATGEGLKLQMEREPSRLPLIPKLRERSLGTLQLAEKTYSRRAATPDGERLWLVVRCDLKWNVIDSQLQDYGLAVILEAHEERLHELIRERLRIRERVRATPRV